MSKAGAGLDPRLPLSTMVQSTRAMDDMTIQTCASSCTTKYVHEPLLYDAHLSLRIPSRTLNPLARAHISTPFFSSPRISEAHSMLADM